MAWTSLTYAFESVLTSAKMTQNQDNFTALAQGLSGAPAILKAAIPASVAYEDEANTFTTNQTIQKADPVILLDDTAAGSTTAKIHFNNDSLYLRTNENETLDQQNDATKPSWALALENTADTFTVYRRPAGGAFAALFGFNNSGTMTVGTVPLARIDGFTGTQVLDVGSIPAHTTSTFNMTITGAALGDFVIVSVSPAVLSNSIVLHARVSNTDTVTVYLTNTSTGAIDPASATYFVKVIKKGFT